MDLSSGEWLSDLANEDPASIMHHCNMMMNSHHVNDGVFEFDHILQPSEMIFTTNNDSASIICNDFEAKIIPNIDSWSFPGKIISFGSSDYETKPKLKKELNDNGSNMRVELPSNREHVVAERRRREKMTQGFVALSALIPDLKKTDKASILAETAEYLKQLEERAKLLEKQTTKTTMESVCLVKKMQTQQYSSSFDHYYSNKTINPNDDMGIEARVLNNNILIRVHSIKKQGLLQTILKEIGELNLLTLNCQTMSFGSFAIDITVIAQVNDDFSMSMEGLVKHVGKALQNMISESNV